MRERFFCSLFFFKDILVFQAKGVSLGWAGLLSLLFFGFEVLDASIDTLAIRGEMLLVEGRQEVVKEVFFEGQVKLVFSYFFGF